LIASVPATREEMIRINRAWEILGRLLEAVQRFARTR